MAACPAPTLLPPSAKLPSSFPPSPTLRGRRGAPRRARMSRARLPVDVTSPSCPRYACEARAGGLLQRGIEGGGLRGGRWTGLPPTSAPGLPVRLPHQRTPVSPSPPLPGGTATTAPTKELLIRLRPQIRRDNPLNLSILLSGGKETKQDSRVWAKHNTVSFRDRVSIRGRSVLHNQTSGCPRLYIFKK